jgi:hypothetical protein
MKRKAFLVLVATVLSVGAFAEHPDGWGLGAGLQIGGEWISEGADVSINLLLKAPKIPIYWGISAPVFDWRFSDPSSIGFVVTGDYYFLHKPLFSNIGLNWFLGAGGYFGFGHYSSGSAGANKFAFGARVPVGLSFMPRNFPEFLLSIAPSLGYYFYTGDDLGGDRNGLDGDLSGYVGVRFWL